MGGFRQYDIPYRPGDTNLSVAGNIDWPRVQAISLYPLELAPKSKNHYG